MLNMLVYLNVTAGIYLQVKILTPSLPINWKTVEKAFPIGLNEIDKMAKIVQLL